MCGSFHGQGQAGDHEYDVVSAGCDALVQQAGGIAETAGEGVFGHDAKADFAGDQDGGGGAGGDCGGEAGGFGGEIGLGEEEVGEPEGEAIDQDRGRAGGLERGDQVERGFGGVPVMVAAGLVKGDPLAHFGIERLGGGEVVPGGLVRREQGFGVAAFAGAGAAEDEGGGNGRGSLRGLGWRSARGRRLEAVDVIL